MLNFRLNCKFLEKMLLSKMMIRCFSASTITWQHVKIPTIIGGIGGKYATAVYCAAVKSNKLDAVENEINNFEAELRKDSKLKMILADPFVHKEEKKRAIDSAAEKLKCSSITKNFFGDLLFVLFKLINEKNSFSELISENGRMLEVENILECFKKLMAAHHGELVCEVTSAKMQARKRLYTPFYKVDPALIAGITVSLGDHYIDMSAASKIDQYSKIMEISNRARLTLQARLPLFALLHRRVDFILLPLLDLLSSRLFGFVLLVPACCVLRFSRTATRTTTEERRCGSRPSVRVLDFVTVHRPSPDNRVSGYLKLSIRTGRSQLSDQIPLSERIYFETEALQIQLEQNLEKDGMQGAMEDWSQYRKTFRRRRPTARALIRQLRKEQEQRPTGGDNSNLGRSAMRIGNGKLLELKLPQFSGEVLEFPTFWAQSEASVHNRSDLDVTTNFDYLLSGTEGKARSAIAGIPLTAANYTHAVEILKTRFEILVDELMKHLRCLKALDKDPYTGHFPVSEALMPMLREKFSPALQSAWDLKTASESLRKESNTEPPRRNRLTSNGITAAVLRRLLRQGGRRSIWNINNSKEFYKRIRLDMMEKSCIEKRRKNDSAEKHIDLFFEEIGEELILDTIFDVNHAAKLSLRLFHGKRNFFRYGRNRTTVSRDRNIAAWRSFREKFLKNYSENELDGDSRGSSNEDVAVNWPNSSSNKDAINVSIRRRRIDSLTDMEICSDGLESTSEDEEMLREQLLLSKLEKLKSESKHSAELEASFGNDSSDSENEDTLRRILLETLRNKIDQKHSSTYSHTEIADDGVAASFSKVERKPYVYSAEHKSRKLKFVKVASFSNSRKGMSHSSVKRSKAISLNTQRAHNLVVNKYKLWKRFSWVASHQKLCELMKQKPVIISLDESDSESELEAVKGGNV
ncbi:ATP synthase subunit O, mitochondrial [Trichinella spiralis]|uniref:Oligomycin sensitivity conferral protein n=1 Tax=Trichinella spiralis TaxID=6334 RepID=A0A0V1BPA3_TRISP|nr:ATP synthase subunit O, mitochondrial [Trichinella spiralis]